MHLECMSMIVILMELQLVTMDLLAIMYGIQNGMVMEI